MSNFTASRDRCTGGQNKHQPVSLKMELWITNPLPWESLLKNIENLMNMIETAVVANFIKRWLLLILLKWRKRTKHTWIYSAWIIHPVGIICHLFLKSYLQRGYRSCFCIFMCKHQRKPLLGQWMEWVLEFSRRRKTKPSNKKSRFSVRLNSFLGKFFAKIFTRKRPSWCQLRLSSEMLNYLHTSLFWMLNLVWLPDTRRLKIHIQIRKGKPWRTDGAEFSIKV